MKLKSCSLLIAGFLLLALMIPMSSIAQKGNGEVDPEKPALLQANGCNTLYLCGLSATGCVLATHFGANERDYPAIMIREGIMSPDKGYTKMVNDICESVSL